MIDSILQAMRADCVPESEAGLWYVKKCQIHGHEKERFDAKNEKNFSDQYRCDFPPPGLYTYLFRWTEATRYGMAMNPKAHGELVMNDFPGELEKHLQFILKARGRVLVTGLGIGCVVRGLLHRDVVDAIDIVERDANVIKLCGHSVEHPKVRIIKCDATVFDPEGKYDWAWHDLWSDTDKNEEHLALIHMRLMTRLMDHVPKQGAWAFGHRFKRTLPEFHLKPARRTRK